MARRGLGRALTRAALLACVVGSSGAACRDRGLAAMEAVRAEVCRCQDASCVTAALAKLPAKDPDDAARTRALAAAIQRCIVELGERTPPSANDDAGVAPEARAPGADRAPATEVSNAPATGQQR
jgi:hypothetical protein